MATTTITHAAEFAAKTGSINESEGIIYGISCICLGEAKGHGLFADMKSLETCLAATKSHPSGVICKGDHGTGVFEAIGTLKNFRIDGEKLRADLHLLKTHPRYASVIELARKAPAAVGLSISFSYAPEIIDEQVYIRVKSLFSIDLVDSPALNPTGMFSTGAIDDGTLEKLAAHVWGEGSVNSWRQRDGAKFSDVLRRRFVFSGLAVPGLNPAPIVARFGAVKQVTGFARVDRANEQAKVDDFFSGAPKSEPAKNQFANLKGLARTEAAFRAQTKTNRL